MLPVKYISHTQTLIDAIATQKSFIHQFNYLFVYNTQQPLLIDSQLYIIIGVR